MKTVYKASAMFGFTITPYLIEKETDYTIWIDGRRVRKTSDSCKFFDTWGEAHAYLLKRSGDKVKRARVALDRAKGKFHNVMDLTKPD